MEHEKRIASALSQLDGGLEVSRLLLEATVIALKCFAAAGGALKS
jgi:hypothetical protein